MLETDDGMGHGMGHGHANAIEVRTPAEDTI